MLDKFDENDDDDDEMIRATPASIRASQDLNKISPSGGGGQQDAQDKVETPSPDAQI